MPSSVGSRVVAICHRTPLVLAHISGNRQTSGAGRHLDPPVFVTPRRSGPEVKVDGLGRSGSGKIKQGAQDGFALCGLDGAGLAIFRYRDGPCVATVRGSRRRRGYDAPWSRSASSARTRRPISSTIGRTTSTGCPAGSGRSQSRYVLPG